MTETNFKHTEVGLIPHDWNIFSVGNDCYIKARIGWQGLTTAEYMDHGDYGLITSTDIVDGKINWKTCWFVSEDRYRQDTKIQVRENDVLISKDGTIGKVGIVKKLPYPATLNSGVFVIRSSNSQQSQKGLSLAFISPFFDDFIKRLTAGSTIVHLYQKDIVNYTYPLPPTTAEQERIVDALSSTDTLIGALTEQIEKKRHIKQGVMQQLLTGKKRLAGFTGEWKEVRLGDLGFIIRGVGFKPEQVSIVYKNGYICLLRSNNVDKACINYDNVIFVDNSCVSDNQIMRREDILICAANGSRNLVGKAGRKIDDQLNTFGAFMCVFRCEDTKSAPFVSFLLQSSSYLKQLDEILAGSAINNLNAKQFGNMTFTIPPTIAEQSAIAAVLSGMDTEIAALEQKRDKYIVIKSGMMQNLLTGKIRLV